jgi:hypothetical protein
LSRLQQFNGPLVCEANEDYVGLSCRLAEIKEILNTTRSPRFNEVDSLLSKCYSRTQNDTSSPWFDKGSSKFLNNYSWGNDRYVLLLEQYDPEIPLFFGTGVKLDIMANPKLLISGPTMSLAATNWLVIAGAWPKGNERKANERFALLKSHGFSVEIIETDLYPNLTPGLSAVVLGPSTKDEAQSKLQDVQSIVPDAFIKSGFRDE